MLLFSHTLAKSLSQRNHGQVRRPLFSSANLTRSLAKLGFLCPGTFGEGCWNIDAAGHAGSERGPRRVIFFALLNIRMTKIRRQIQPNFPKSV